MTESISSALEAKRAELSRAEAELNNWGKRDIGLTLPNGESLYRDGSPSQDLRNEVTGDSLRKEVKQLQEDIEALEEQEVEQIVHEF
ncbi:hypothetical protein [Aeromonas veronii]|uniref:hypothetical protein n=1 Tax=Aeromonas veronii TaxID=654 RepID=UPI0011160FA3|nr:hypothetical protein [Aeromonas veronii]TNI33524.1 hypothetical protein CF128_19200 [Aeromonas veronii]TNJ15829.1 hypothetical protein CF113_11675 [Aeromonas veronii]